MAMEMQVLPWDRQNMWCGKTYLWYPTPPSPFLIILSPTTIKIYMYNKTILSNTTQTRGLVDFLNFLFKILYFNVRACGTKVT
jgi:hypothetical protein